nr:2390_t:CDS:2 [Entrophospora candida]
MNTLSQIGTNLDLYYYDKSKNNSGVFIDLFSLPLPLTKYTSEKEEIFLIGMVIFERVISSIQPAIKELNQSISKPIDPTRFLLLTPVEDQESNSQTEIDIPCDYEIS